MSALLAPADDGGDRRIISWRRMALSLTAGVAAAIASALFGQLRLTALIGWTAAASSLLGWVWQISWHQDRDGTKRLAEEEARTRVTDAAVLLAAVASLVAVFEAVITAGRHDAVAAVAVVLAVADTILSWALMNTVFALKYARLYYSGVDGGIDFAQKEPPAYSDFAYLAFTLGMSFAVSDSALASTDIRKVGLGHALLSYLFGTVLIAVAVSLLTSL